MKGGNNESVMCASPAVRVNRVNHAIPIPYAIHVRDSLGINRSTGDSFQKPGVRIWGLP